MSEVELTQQSPRHFVGIRRKVHTSELPGFYAEVLPKVMNWMRGKGIEPASAPMSMWCEMDMESGIADTHAGCFVASERESGRRPGAGWEIYVDDPGEVEADALRTEIYLPVE